MAYRDFSFERLTRDFGATNEVAALFGPLPPVEPSEHLRRTLDIAATLPLRSEKARSEYVVTPILFELIERNHLFFTLYSGEMLNIDKEQGLVGEIDFFIAKRTNTYSINLPVVSIVEAKKRDFDLGIPQCAAQMLAAYRLNLETGIELPLYGCVTVATEWQFLRLENNHFVIDRNTYRLENLANLLGVFQYILDHYRSRLQGSDEVLEPEVLYKALWR